MIHIVVPMAGRGQRFVDAGYLVPKPLIPVHGVPMIDLVVGNVRPSDTHRFIFVCQQAHLSQFNVRQHLQRLAPGCVVLEVPEVTDGAACTVLVAREYIDNDDQVMIVNSDQLVDCSIDSYLAGLGDYDGLIMTMQASDAKWSFVRLGADQRVLEVREKEVVSNHATVGIYNFRKGSDFVWAAHQMMRKNLRVNNEFYVAPTYNELIQSGKRIGIFEIGGVGHGMYGLGVPTDLENFLALPLSKELVDRYDPIRKR